MVSKFFLLQARLFCTASTAFSRALTVVWLLASEANSCSCRGVREKMNIRKCTYFVMIMITLKRNQTTYLYTDFFFYIFRVSLTLLKIQLISLLLETFLRYKRLWLPAPAGAPCWNAAWRPWSCLTSTRSHHPHWGKRQYSEICISYTYTDPCHIFLHEV